MFKKVFSLLVVLTLTACSTMSFNQRYESVGWNKVIIAPFTGEQTDIAEQEFEHLLSTTSKLLIVPASTVKHELVEKKLQDLYEQNPISAMEQLAKTLKADGILFAYIQTENKSMKYNVSMREASIFAKLVDSKSRETVASSQFEVSSMVDNTNELVKSVSHDAIEEMDVFFDKLNGTESSFFSF